MAEFNGMPAATPDAIVVDQSVQDDVLDQVEDDGVSDTPDAPKVAESDEQKAERLVKERQVREARSRRKVQERISELVTARKAAEDREQRLLSLLSQGRQNANVSQTATPDEAPKREQFDDYEAYMDARTEYRAVKKAQEIVEQSRKQAQEQTQQQHQSTQAAEVRRTFEGRMQEFSKTVPDWDSVVADNDGIEIPDATAGLLHLRADGPAILYAIGKNPALVQRLKGQSPYVQAMVVGEIAASLKSTPQVSKAPKPGNPVGSRSASSKDPSHMSPDEYYAHITAARSGGKR